MLKSLSILALAFLLAFAMGCSSDLVQPDSADALDGSSVKIDGADQGGSPLVAAEMLGSKEVPGPGDPDGSGSAVVTMNIGKQTVCFDIDVADVAPIVAAHIHVGDASVSGGVVVNFNVAANGLDGCVGDVDRSLIRTILQNPADYYVNVHNADFPPGALRDQLARPED